MSMERMLERSGSMKEFKRDRKEYHAVGKCIPKKDSDQLLLGKPVFMDDIIPKDCLIVKTAAQPSCTCDHRRDQYGGCYEGARDCCCLYMEGCASEEILYCRTDFPEPSPYDRLILDQRCSKCRRCGCDCSR